MKVLVTGGAGYIGSHTVDMLVKQGHQVVILDNLSTGSERLVIAGELVRGDLADTALLEQIFTQHRFDAVVHFAASIFVDESLDHPDLYYENNVNNTLSLVRQCTQQGVESLVFSSTAAVYGAPDKELINEDTLPQPTNPYGTSKLCAEWLIQDICRATSLRCAILRYFNVAGADPELRLGEMRDSAKHLITVACKTASGVFPKMRVFGTDYPTADGTCVRDFIHVCDIADAHVRVLEYLKEGGQSTTLNCGYAQGYSVREVIDVVRRVTAVDFPVIDSARRPMDIDPPRLVADNRKIKQVIGWQPLYDDLEKIIRMAWAWELKQKH